MSKFKNIEQQLTNLVEEYYGTDHYGRILLQNPEEVNDKEGTVYTIRYNGGPRLIDDLYKARNGRYVWKNTGNGIERNSKGGYKLFVTSDYRTAINMVSKYGGDIVKQDKNEFNESLLYESPMYQSPKANFTDFYNYVITNPKCKKCYYQLQNYLQNYNLRIPSDTILHDYKKHDIELEDWYDYFSNIENIQNALISNETIGSSPAQMALIRVKGLYDYGCAIRLEKTYNEITTLFIDNPNSIDNWIKTSAGGLTSQLSAPDTSKGSSVTQSSQMSNDIITQIKDKIKWFNQNMNINNISEKQTKNTSPKVPTVTSVPGFPFNEKYKNNITQIKNKIKCFNENYLNEGEVVSLLDYKNKKALDNIPNDVIQDIDNYIEENTWKINIEGVYIKSCETVKGITLFGNGETRSYIDFQNRVYSVDYALQKIDQTAKLDYTAYLTINGQKEQTEFNGRIYLGTDRYDVDLMELITERTEKELAKSVLFINNPVKYNEASYEKDYLIFKQRLDKKRKQIEKEQPKETSDNSYIRDYTKDPQEVAVGDIIYTIWGYNTTQYSYYRVIERKAKSIKLEALATKYLTGGGMYGECIPDSQTVPDNDIDGKLFRISNYGDNIVCKIGNHSAYFWDGKPDSYNTMD